MEIADEYKGEILLAMLEHRYSAIERIRDRVYRFAIWTLRIFLGAIVLIVTVSLAGTVF